MAKLFLAMTVLVSIVMGQPQYYKVELVGSDHVCLGSKFLVKQENAPRKCSVLTLTKSGQTKRYSSRYYHIRVGQPKACSMLPQCHATSTECTYVDQLAPDATYVQFYADPARFSPGWHHVRMYDTTSNYLAYKAVKLIRCTDAPDTPAPMTDIPTSVPVSYECVEADPPIIYSKVDTTELMDGWSDCSFNLKHIPGEWFAGFTCRGTADVPTGTTYTFKCPAYSEYPCDWFVTHYHCPPCSSAENGGWPGILTTEGWESGSCGPRIVNPFHYETVTYRRQLAIGETMTIGPSVKPTKYLTFHMVPGVECSSLSVLECDTTKFCSVDGGRCIANWCPRRLIPQPARPPCTNCIEQCIL
eukprot:TRINITY_DN901_c0_g1_i1.p1 TRINITY_DN901_c0_g1~~TRINITY_DN901_c0_g1_i1.p1  ORF type:complete len:358 (+),score=48.56 TRINITY_DN901_c0_g1_i1:65-1138(+)